VTTTAQIRARAHAQTDEPTLGAALAMVESRLAAQIGSREDLLADVSHYLIGSGGKRVRPVVTLLVFRACGGRELRDIVDVAAALELIHSASLLHDDIIDGGSVRRGKESAYRKYGLANALVAGDFIFSRAFQLCARFEEKLINWAAEACISLTEGEVMQGRFRHNPAVTFQDYLEIISRKTASIFQQGARTAAYLAGAAEPVVEAMAACGFNVGMTFQVVDDLLDVEGTEERVGKPVGIDLRDGNPSLPIVLAARCDPEVARAFQTPELTESEIVRIQDRIRASGVLAKARALAVEYGERARRSLEILPPSPDKDEVAAVIDQLLHRTE
jgi:octaprenyl-diphosphate synthase